MFDDRRTDDSALALSGGFGVVASDGPVGIVETPLFPPDQTEPDFLVLRVGDRLHQRHPVLPAALVERVDPQSRVVHVHGTRKTIAGLPEHLPLAI